MSASPTPDSYKHSLLPLLQLYFILSHLSSFDPQTRSLCYLLLFKETSLSTWSIPQLMRDATDTDLILSISAMDILLRIIEVPEKVNSTVSAMMEMEREMSV